MSYELWLSPVIYSINSWCREDKVDLVMTKPYMLDNDSLSDQRDDSTIIQISTDRITLFMELSITADIELT